MTELVQLPHHCYEAIRNVATKKGFIDFDLDIDSGSSKGDNYLGEIYRVTVRGKQNCDNILHLLLKVAPRLDIREEIPLDIMYSREIFAYNEVFKAFRELQDKLKVSPSVKFSFVECFHTSEEHAKELLIFEDLKAQGFVMLERKKRVDFEHAKLMLESQAKLHALSFVMQKQDPHEYNRLQKRVPDYMIDIKCFEKFVGSSLDLAIKVVENPALKDKIIQFMKTYWEGAKESLIVDKYGVICHGDSWINNVLFKYQGGRPVDVRLIDYQILRHGAPTVDVLYLLLSSTDGQFRSAYYQKCLEHYYNCLSTVLQEYAYNVDDIFPKEEFYNQLKTSAKFVFTVGISFCKPMVSYGEDSMDVIDIINHDAMQAPTGEAYEKYSKRVTELVQDCIEYGYI